MVLRFTSSRKNPKRNPRIIGPDMSGSWRNWMSHFLNFITERVLILILYRSTPSSFITIDVSLLYICLTVFTHEERRLIERVNDIRVESYLWVECLLHLWRHILLFVLLQRNKCLSRVLLFAFVWRRRMLFVIHWKVYVDVHISSSLFR